MKLERLSEQNRFIAFLHSLREQEDRGALASLRRGLGKPPGSTPETFALVIPRLPEGATKWEEKIYFVIASLFALHPSPEGEGDMGDVFRRIYSKTESESIESRFVAMLRAHKEDLPEHLRHAVALAKSHDVPINWNELIIDLRKWYWTNLTTQQKWARSFWKERSKETEEKER
jgi:CRISPR system Cascade subunit CasB